MKTDSKNIINLTYDDGGVFGVENLDSAYAFCKLIALGHYENFPVASIFIPKSISNYFFAVYAYSRIADDLGDELENDTISRFEALTDYEKLLTYDLSNNSKKNPIFLALQDTILQKNIPLSPFIKLIQAFKYDAKFQPFPNIDTLFDYCKNSANPVGEIILRLYDNFNEEAERYSDAVCTALQLVNFWQDISRDKMQKRIYIPLDILKKYGINSDVFTKEQTDGNLTQCLDELFDITEALFEEGKKLIPLLKSFRLKSEIKSTIAGGEMILKKCRTYGQKLYFERPDLTKIDYLRILMRGVFYI